MLPPEVIDAMPLSRETIKSIRRIASMMVQEDEPFDPQSTLLSGFRQAVFPPRLRQQDDPQPTLLITGDEYRAFEESLGRLVLEPELEHLDPQDIDSSLWDLICELFLQKDTFKNAQKRAERVRAYLETIAKPHSTFQVAFPIEHLRLEAPISISGVRMEHWGREKAREWSIYEGADLTDDFAGSTVAVVSVRAGTNNRAIERAKPLVDRALEALRFGYATSSRIRIRDSELIFRQGDKALVRQEDGARSHSWHLRFRPSEVTLSPTLVSRTVEYLQPLDRLASNENLRLSFRKRFSLALHWISTAMTRDDYDEKLVDVCTALESMLTQRSDHRKGELIALRAMLLQCTLEGRFQDTLPILRLYEIRSKIVHGSGINLCGEGQYTHLLGFAGRLVMQAAELSDRNPSVKRFDDFRKTIELEEMLGVAIRWFTRYGKEGQNVVDEAKKRLPA